jgi:hypothetical protein
MATPIDDNISNLEKCHVSSSNTVLYIGSEETQGVAITNERREVIRKLACHMIGDYLLQSDWMATQKTTNSKAALAHAVVYSLPFLSFKPRPVAYAGIIGTHFLIDRFRLARYAVWAKNYIAPPGQDHTLTPTGMPEATPNWLSTWLLIITDNIIHNLINAFFLRGK